MAKVTAYLDEFNKVIEEQCMVNNYKLYLVTPVVFSGFL